MTDSKANSKMLPVVIINGLGAPYVAARAFGLVFRSRGYRVFTAPQWALNYGDIRKSAERVAREVERVRRVTGSEKVHLVGMSLGGLTGLYYVKCAGGAEHTRTLISIGGPLNGSPLARIDALFVPRLIKSLGQTHPDKSELLREIRLAPQPEGVQMYSVGTKGDFITPRESWDVPGMEPVETPHGVFPVGHWMLFVHPGNHKAVLELLESPPA